VRSGKGNRTVEFYLTDCNAAKPTKMAVKMEDVTAIGDDFLPRDAL